MSNGNMSTGVKIILGLILFAVGAALFFNLQNKQGAT